MLSLDVSTAQMLPAAATAGPQYVDIIQKGAGRMLRSPSLWEDAAKTLFTTNCTWALTRKMCAAACSERFSRPAPSGICPFPQPAAFAALTPEALKSLMPVGYRASFVQRLSAIMAQDPTLQRIEENPYPFAQAAAIARSIPGFGAYAGAHLLLLAGYYDEIPVDTVVVAYLKKNHRVRKPQSFIDRTYRKWGRYRWWGLKLETIIRDQNWLGD